MLEEDDSKPALLTAPGQTLSLTEAGKRILSEKTVQIKQENSTISAQPKVIRINAANGTQPTTVNATQPKIIRLSSSQLNNLKMGNLNGKSKSKIRKSVSQNVRKLIVKLAEIRMSGSRNVRKLGVKLSKL